MQINIPLELIEYVRMSKKDGLVHNPDMPKNLIPVFEETRTLILKLQKKREKEISDLLIKEK